MPPLIAHHGAADGVTGSCRQLTLADGQSALVDRGLFRGAETSAEGGAGASWNHLKAVLSDPRHEAIFPGYQASGTPGREIQTYGPGGGYVTLDGARYDIRAQVHTVGGFSAHAAQR